MQGSKSMQVISVWFHQTLGSKSPSPWKHLFCLSAIELVLLKSQGNYRWLSYFIATMQKWEASLTWQNYDQEFTLMVETAVEKLDGVRNIFYTVQHLEGRAACSYSYSSPARLVHSVQSWCFTPILWRFPPIAASFVAGRCVHPFKFLGKFFAQLTILTPYSPSS